MKIFGAAVKAIIKNKDGKFLVLFKSDKEDINPKEIDLPGGRIEFGEEAPVCLAREVREETNLEIEIKKPSRVWTLIKGDFHLLGITFLADFIGGEINLSGEHDAYRWVNKEDILAGEYPDRKSVV